MKNSFRDQIVIYCYDIMNLTNLRKTKDIRLKTNIEEEKLIYLHIHEYISEENLDEYKKLLNKMDLLIDLDDCTLGE